MRTILNPVVILAFINFCLGASQWPLKRGSQEFLPQADFAVIDRNDAQFIDMPIDHKNSNSTTFKNRFWVNSTYYKPGGPVFIFDAGEQNAEPLLPYYLQEYHGLSATMRLAKRYNGIAILWEHRFYGESLPFPVNERTTAGHWKFLNTEQALDDVVYFAKSFPREIDSKLPALHPSVTPWVWLGGSYPGVRGALLRIRNPEIIFAAWASSAPVQAQIDMASYYKAAQRSLTKNCSADWSAVTRYVDDVLVGENETLKTDVKFALEFARLSGKGGNTTLAKDLTRDRASKLSPINLAYAMLDPLSFFQYYGFGASLLPFCDLLETHNFTTGPSEGGLVASHGIELAFNAFSIALAELDYNHVPRNPSDPVAARSWMWQYCSEYGYYQRGERGNPLSIVSAYQSISFFQYRCRYNFPDGLPEYPEVDKINRYGGWNMNPSNVLITNGEFDPWRTLSHASIEPHSPQRKPSVVVPKCNTSPEFPSFFGVTYQNMVHVPDMRVLLTPDANHTDFKTIGYYSPISPEPFYRGLGLFQLALDEWLPCFLRRG